MPRAPREYCESNLYHVYSKGVGGQILFEDDADRRKFMFMLDDMLTAYGADVYAYCLMGNHFHFLLHQREGSYSKAVGTLKERYAKYYNNSHDRTGPLYNSRFGSKPICTDEHLLTVVRYIHLNPVAAHVSRTCEYPWSSYRDYIDAPPGSQNPMTHFSRRSA